MWLDPHPHPRGLRGDHHLISPRFHYSSEEGCKPHMQEEPLAPSVRWDVRVMIKGKPCVRC